MKIKADLAVGIAIPPGPFDGCCLLSRSLLFLLLAGPATPVRPLSPPFRQDLTASLQHRLRGHRPDALHVPRYAIEEQAAVAVDVRAKDPVSLSVGVPGCGPVARGEDRDARSADRGREVHGAGVVSKIERASMERRGRRTQPKRARGVVAPAPGQEQALTLL